MAEEVTSPSKEAAATDPIRGSDRALSDAEKNALGWIKSTGAAMHGFFEEMCADMRRDTGETSRELEIAKTKIEEAVMWAVKHITA